jgi:LacI family transcriptional regulator
VDPRIAHLQKHHLPFVAFGRTTGKHDYSYIDVDGEAGVNQAMEHLLQLGHRRIAYLGVHPNFGFSHYRLAGYCQALKRAGLPYDQALIHQGLSESSAGAAMRGLLALSERPTAVFAAADFLGLAALKRAREHGLSVPKDLSVSVFDDSSFVQHAEPPLTAVSQPNRRLGEEAAGLLLDRVASPDTPLVQRLVVPSLVIRASTAPPCK